MRKGIIALAAALLAGTLTGCGASDADKPLKDMKVDKYVTLGEYKGLEVAVEPVTVDENRVNELMHSVYDQHVTAENNVITDRAVENGDTVNIDYQGKKDGVAFDGGTAYGSPLTIGSGSFIAGFEEGLVGVMPGETLDLNLSFPEGYQAADLAGQEVVFTVTVNFILPPEMEDAVVPKIGIESVNTVEELHQYTYDYLYNQAESNYNATVQGLVMEAFMNTCVFKKELPKQMIEKYREMARENVEAQAKSLGVDAETFTNYFYQTDLESFVANYSEETARQNAAMQAVANREGLNISDEQLNATLQEHASLAGYTSVEEYVGETPTEEYREYLLLQKVLQYLVDNAIITE